MLFAYSTSGDPIPVTKAEVVAVPKLARHVTSVEANDVEFINDKEDEPPRPPKIPVPMLFIGNSRLCDVVSSVASLKDSLWVVHTVHYQPSIRAGFKKSDRDSSPHVTLSLSYARALNAGGLLRAFKKFTGIQKPLDWCHAGPAGVVDSNDGCCGIDHLSWSSF